MSKPKWYKVTYKVQWGVNSARFEGKIENILAYDADDAKDQVIKIMRLDPFNHWPQVSDLKAKRINPRDITRSPGRGADNWARHSS
jgi:hypothetical protein